MTSKNYAYPPIPSDPFNGHAMHQYKPPAMNNYSHDHHQVNYQRPGTVYGSQQPYGFPIQAKILKRPEANICGILYAISSCGSSFTFFWVYAFLAMNPQMMLSASACMLSCVFMFYFWIRSVFDRKYLSGSPGIAQLWPIAFSLLSWLFLWYSVPLKALYSSLPPGLVIDRHAITANVNVLVGLGCIMSLFDYFVFSRDDDDGSCCLFLKPFVRKPVDNEQTFNNI